MNHNAWIFPGQGSQKIGMGKALAEAFGVAREVFAEIDDTLGQHLSRLMFEGPLDELTLTENAQPALMAASMAVVRVLEREAGHLVATHCRMMAGHSLGEYSALAASGALSIADTARLLRLRGQAMQRAVAPGKGKMAALIGLDMDAVAALANEAATHGVCEIANDNAPGQIVISGEADAIDIACELAKARGAKRALPLPVSAPFHCSLMQPAAGEMREALAKVTLKTPVVPIIANITAAPEQEPDTIRALLVEQVTGRVRWVESVKRLGNEGITRLYELGEGNVLCGLVKRIDPALTASAIGTPDAIDLLIKAA